MRAPAYLKARATWMQLELKFFRGSQHGFGLSVPSLCRCVGGVQYPVMRGDDADGTPQILSESLILIII